VLRVLDLFSGIGGFSLGLKRTGGFRTICYCEIDLYCQEVLKARMQDGSLDMAPIWDDITKFEGQPWRGHADLVCGGFPCQDISSAGGMAGISGSRSSLWFEMGRIIREVRPQFAVVENVAGLSARGLGDVLGDLAESGYDTEWDGLPASAFGAPHERDRVFIVAYPHPNGESQRKRPLGKERGRLDNGSEATPADTQRRRLQGRIFGLPESTAIKSSPLCRTSLGTGVGKTWQTEPGESWLDDGLPNGLAEASSRSFGNAVVPQVVEWIGNRILKRIERRP